MGVLILGVLTLLAACRSDAERLALAMDPATPQEQALAHCQALRSADTAGSCALAVLERGGLDAPRCAGLSDPLWRDECTFRLAEQQAAGGALGQGVATCHHTRFGRECAFHLIRAQARLAVDEPPDQAAARLPALSTSGFTPDYARLFWRERFRAAQGQDRPAAAAECAGLAEPGPCAQAWRELWSQALLALGRAELCARARAGEPVLTLRAGVPAFLPRPEDLAAVAAGCGDALEPALR